MLGFRSRCIVPGVTFLYHVYVTHIYGRWYKKVCRTDIRTTIFVIQTCSCEFFLIVITLYYCNTSLKKSSSEFFLIVITLYYCNTSLKKSSSEFFLIVITL